MKKLDINKYVQNQKKYKKKLTKNKPLNTAASLLNILLRSVISLLIIGVLTAIFVLAAIYIYITSSVEETEILDINAAKLSLTSMIYVNDSEEIPQEYERVFNSENRIWVNLNEIPQYMRDAIISIEDKRFFEHHGVDWVRTGSAVFNLLANRKSHGGSTLTQQLVKNLTADNETSLNRKFREIRRALNLEKHYSKDDLLEAYLNIVNFGAGTRGVQAAANIYFNKKINECTLAQCATIASITQNPTLYNPFRNPENNKKRREIILAEMKSQNKISDAEYSNALEESQNLDFNSKSGASANNTHQNNLVRNWYVEALLRDVINDFTEKYKIGKDAAEDILFTHGIKIYCALDKNVQEIIENTVKDMQTSQNGSPLELGFVMMDYRGRILGTIGSSQPKAGNLLYDRANHAKRQPGSTIKPLAIYAPAIEWGNYKYSSLIPDKPLQIPDERGGFKNWPANWYGYYKEQVLLNWAVEHSANAPPAQILNLLTPQKCCNFLRKKLGFLNLDSIDENSLAALAAGGTHVGVTVREMTSAFQVFGNGGKYFKPYTYFYVADRNNKIILDNRENAPIQAIKPETATIMNRLLRNVIVGPAGTGKNANISGCDVIGKTGTTTDDFDSWFMGLTPHSVSGIWTGYDKPKRIHNTAEAIKIWKKINENYLKNKKNKEYIFSENVAKYQYCTENGLLATTACPQVATGYYDINSLPAYCSKHDGGTKSQVNNETAEEDNESSNSEETAQDSSSAQPNNSTESNNSQTAGEGR
jgi:penicillin-binding protein 1A